MSNTDKVEYGADQIQILEGLEAVRKRNKINYRIGNDVPRLCPR